MKDKVFITGASGGIGSALTKKFNEIGHKLILTSSSKEKLSKFELYGNQHDYYILDLSDLTNLESVMNEIISDHPDISILVHNAVQLQIASSSYEIKSVAKSNEY